jgi:hypothetical protein
LEFKLKAVKLSQLKGVEVQAPTQQRSAQAAGYCARSRDAVAADERQVTSRQGRSGTSNTDG